MKFAKFVTILTLVVFCMLLSTMTPVQAADGATPQVGIKADVGQFTSPSFRGSLLYSVEVFGSPFGLNSMSVQSKTNDTTYTFNIYTSVATYKSNSDYDNANRMEAVRTSVYATKTIAKYLSIDIGVSGWNFFDVDQFGDDKTYSGVMAGLTLDIYGVKLTASGHNIVIIKEPDLYAWTGSLSYAIF